jgi:hypothetical protein
VSGARWSSAVSRMMPSTSEDAVIRPIRLRRCAASTRWAPNKSRCFPSRSTVPIPEERRTPHRLETSCVSTSPSLMSALRSVGTWILDAKWWLRARRVPASKDRRGGRPLDPSGVVLDRDERRPATPSRTEVLWLTNGDGARVTSARAKRPPPWKISSKPGDALKTNRMMGSNGR